jgi:hypothetical protein
VSRLIWSVLGRRIYPPSPEDQLRELHKRINAAPISDHYKHSLFFYLLKDFSDGDGEEVPIAESFAQKVHLEKRFWTFVEGLWLLDNLEYTFAVSNLTHPSIIPTFPDEIMAVLLRHTSTPTASPDEAILPLAYYNCANPPLAGKEVKTDFVKYMADRNVTETLFWIRGRPEYEQRELLEVLVEETLDRNGWGPDDKTYTREDKAMEFVSLPLTETEENWVETYLIEGKGRTLRGASDTVEMRRIATGRLKEAAGNAGLKGRKHDQVNWEVLRDGVKRGLGPRTDA